MEYKYLGRFDPKLKITIIFSVIFSIILSSVIFLFYKSILVYIISFILILVLIFIYMKVRTMLKISARIKKIETVFPDFLQLMSSNLRAGMTIDKALLLSSRPEFTPLDKEILKTGKDITVGKNIEEALVDMSKRIGSPKIEKVISLINSGISAGGDLAILLDETSRNMRGREVLEKKATSNILMYIIFIFLTVSFFAPALFSLSNVLVGILTEIFAGIPDVETTANIPFTLSKINISTDFILYFSIFFIIVIDIFSSFVLGLIYKGEEKQGFRYIPIIITLSLGTFFITRFILTNFLSGFF